MEKVIARILEAVPGVVVGTSIDGNRQFWASGNRQTFETPAPMVMLPDTSFDLGSVTKIVATTASLMKLVEESYFALDDKVSKFLPEWTSSEKDSITVRDLLLHRSGLWEWRPLYIDIQDSSLCQGIIAKIPLRYPVDGARHYSDLGFITLGHVLSKIMDTSLDELVTTLVLNPMNLSATRFAHPQEGATVAATSFGDAIEKKMVSSGVPYPVPERVEDFIGWRERVLVGEVNDGNAFHLFGGVSSHAGLFSNAQDLLTFGEAMLAIDPRSEFFADGPDRGQHLGFRSWSDVQGNCTARFYGHTGFPGTVLVFSPLHNCVITLLTNRLHVAGEPAPTEELMKHALAAFHGQIHS